MPKPYILMPSISIIIPTSGDSPHLEDCLSSIKKLDYNPKHIQTIVITNRDLKKTGRSFSFSRAVNLAATKARGEYFLITNDDIVFAPASLKSLVKAKKRNPNTILGGKLFDKTTHEPAAAGYTMNLLLGIIRPVFTGNKPTPCDWVSACALLLSQELWKKLQGFDERFAPGFFEDADLCLRAGTLGAKSLLIPEVELLHAQTATFNRDKSKKYEYWYRNKILFLRKHASPIKLATNLLVQYALFTPFRGLILHDGRFLPALKGLTWNLKHL